MSHSSLFNNSPSLEGLRLLVAEDEPDSGELLVFVFEDAGAEVLAVQSIREAIEALESFKPHLLISDLQFPDGDGYSLIRELRNRESKIGGKIPAIAVTGKTGYEERDRILSNGFQQYVSKPISPLELVKLVATLMGR